MARGLALAHHLQVPSTGGSSRSGPPWRKLGLTRARVTASLAPKNYLQG